MKIRTSGFIDDMGGSSGGTNAYRDRTGLHFRNMSGRVNSHSVKIVKSRERFYYVMSHWSLLRDRQMIAWNKVAANFSNTDKLGNTFTYYGREMFQRFNRNLFEIGEKIRLDPPQNLKVQNFKSFSVELIQEGYEIKDILLHIKPKIAKDMSILIFATYPVKHGRLFINPDKYCIIGSIDSDFKSGKSILPLYQSVYLNPKDTYFKIGFKFKPVNRESGIPGVMLEYISHSDEHLETA